MLNERRSVDRNPALHAPESCEQAGQPPSIDLNFDTVCTRALGYGSLRDVIDTVDALRSTVEISSLPIASLHKWAAILRSGSMAAQRSHDPRWFDWFADAWELALALENFDVLHDLCGDISALRPNQVGKQIADLRMRGAIAGFALANLSADTTKQLKSLARNADRLLWVGQIAAAEHILKRHNVRKRIESNPLSRNNHCLVLDSLCALSVATSDLTDALVLANELNENAFNMPIYEAHAHFHMGMIAVKRFNFAKARECLETLDSLSSELGSVDAAEEMQLVLRTAWDTGRTPKPIYKREHARLPLDANALRLLSLKMDDAIRVHQPSMAKVLPRFSSVG